MNQEKKIEGKKGLLIGQSLLPRLLLMALTYLIITGGMILAVSPERYSLSVGDIAPKTITATKDVVDEVTTQLRRERAAESVPISYKEDDTVLPRVTQRFDDAFDSYEAVRAEGERIRLSYGDGGFSGVFSREELDSAARLAPGGGMNDWQLTILMKQSKAELDTVRNATALILSQVMLTTIREGQEAAAIANIQRQVSQVVSSDLASTVAMPAVRMSIAPNMVIDQAATEANREAARQEVEPYLFKSGQNIIVAGERVTLAQLRVLDNLSLLEGARQDSRLIIGTAVLGLLIMVSLVFHIFQFDAKLMAQLKNAMILSSIAMLTLGVCLLSSQVNPYLAPVSMMALLVAPILSPTLSLTANVLALIIVGVLTNTTTTFTRQMLNILFAGVLSAPVGIFIVRRKQMRASTLFAGLSMAVTSFFAMIAIGLLTNNEFVQVLSSAIWSAGGNLLAAVLSVGAQPILEWAFSLVTPYKLLELSNPSQPLMRRLLVETPGTYHHAILVANLAEAAAEAIGADALLARVGAYYHDIGKLTRPLYFRENQVNENPHDFTDPRVSAAIIAEHVRDGITLAQKHRLPREIIDFIAMHHGDTQISFFYQKMLSMEGGEAARIEDFTYPGPRPQTVETAILMLADTVEAAVRAGGDQEPAAMEARIRELIRDKIDTGQLNESPLRFADVSRIIRAFAQVLTGIYHKRIEYPRPTGYYTLPPARPEAVRVSQAEDAVREKTEE